MARPRSYYNQFATAELGHVSLRDTYRGLEALIDKHAPERAPTALLACGFGDAEEVRIAARRNALAVERRERAAALAQVEQETERLLRAPKRTRARVLTVVRVETQSKRRVG